MRPQPALHEVIFCVVDAARFVAEWNSAAAVTAVFVDVWCSFSVLLLHLVTKAIKPYTIVVWSGTRTQMFQEASDSGNSMEELKRFLESHSY